MVLERKRNQLWGSGNDINIYNVIKSREGFSSSDKFHT